MIKINEEWEEYPDVTGVSPGDIIKRSAEKWEKICNILDELLSVYGSRTCPLCQANLNDICCGSCPLVSCSEPSPWMDASSSLIIAIHKAEIMHQRLSDLMDAPPTRMEG